MSKPSVCVKLDQDIGLAAQAAVQQGLYESINDIISDALRDWQEKHQRQQQELQNIKASLGQLVSGIKTNRS